MGTSAGGALPVRLVHLHVTASPPPPPLASRRVPSTTCSGAPRETTLSSVSTARTKTRAPALPRRCRCCARCRAAAPPPPPFVNITQRAPLAARTLQSPASCPPRAPCSPTSVWQSLTWVRAGTGVIVPLERTCPGAACLSGPAACLYQTHRPVLAGCGCTKPQHSWWWWAPPPRGVARAAKGRRTHRRQAPAAARLPHASAPC